jgi:hypothetical protein
MDKDKILEQIVSPIMVRISPTIYSEIDFTPHKEIFMSLRINPEVVQQDGLNYVTLDEVKTEIRRRFEHGLEFLFEKMENDIVFGWRGK